MAFDNLRNKIVVEDQSIAESGGNRSAIVFFALNKDIDWWCPVLDISTTTVQRVSASYSSFNAVKGNCIAHVRKPSIAQEQPIRRGPFICFSWPLRRHLVSPFNISPFNISPYGRVDTGAAYHACVPGSNPPSIETFLNRN